MENTTAVAAVILRKKEEYRVLAGHPWVFSNEIAAVEGSPAAGDVVALRSSTGAPLGVGFYHPHSLIAVRRLASGAHLIDRAFFADRIARAAALRRMLVPDGGACRLVHGEADFLPGLVVDRYGPTLALQTLSFGMDARQGLIVDVLQELLQPATIVERNESPLRLLESLPQRAGVLSGSPGEVEIVEHGVRYRVDPLLGQKTGLFLDQRENRRVVRAYCPGARVLDCFCNDGGFALNAAAAGASSVLGIDISPEAVAHARANAELNGLAATFQEGDVFDRLRTLRDEGGQYDVIVLDPPSFTRNRKSVPVARKGYRQLHALAFPLLAPGGVLLTASCSHHITAETFLDDVRKSAARAGKALQLLEWHGAAPDHPVLPGVPETEYLKCGLFRAFPAD